MICNAVADRILEGFCHNLVHMGLNASYIYQASRAITRGVVALLHLLFNLFLLFVTLYFVLVYGMELIKPRIIAFNVL